MNYFKGENWVLNGRSIEGVLAKELYVAIKAMADKAPVSIEGNKYELSLGEDDTGIYSEVTSNKLFCIAIAKKNKEVFTALSLNRKTGFAVEDEDSFERRVSMLLLRIYMMCEKNDFMSKIDDAMACLKNVESKTASDDAWNELFLAFADIQAYVQTAINNSNSAENRPIIYLNINKVESGEIKPSKVFFGKFYAYKSVSKEEAVPEYKKIKNDFILNPDRTFSAEESALMYKVADWHIPSHNVINIAHKIKASWDGDPFLRKTNILMEGPKGTGKTSDAKMLAALLGLPYTKYTCFSDMDSSSVTGGIYPVLDEEEDFYIPSDDEIFFDPAGAFAKITGKALSAEEQKAITEKDVRLAIERAHQEHLKNAEGNSNPRYVFHPSEFVKAFENGWLIEIQERATRLAVKSCYTIKSI